jgi:hypothetical protein
MNLNEAGDAASADPGPGYLKLLARELELAMDALRRTMLITRDRHGRDVPSVVGVAINILGRKQI